MGSVSYLRAQLQPQPPPAALLPPEEASLLKKM